MKIANSVFFFNLRVQLKEIKHLFSSCSKAEINLFSRLFNLLANVSIFSLFAGGLRTFYISNILIVFVFNS